MKIDWQAGSAIRNKKEYFGDLIYELSGMRQFLGREARDEDHFFCILVVDFHSNQASVVSVPNRTCSQVEASIRGRRLITTTPLPPPSSSVITNHQQKCDSRLGEAHI